MEPGEREDLIGAAPFVNRCASLRYRTKRGPEEQVPQFPPFLSPPISSWAPLQPTQPEAKGHWSQLMRSLQVSLRGTEQGAEGWRTELEGLGKTPCTHPSTCPPCMSLLPWCHVRLCCWYGNIILGKTDVVPFFLPSFLHQAPLRPL